MGWDDEFAYFSYSYDDLTDNLVKDIIILFKKNWTKMKNNKFTGKKQNLKKGSIHYRNQFKSISKIDLKICSP